MSGNQSSKLPPRRRIERLILPPFVFFLLWPPIWVVLEMALGPSSFTALLALALGLVASFFAALALFRHLSSSPVYIDPQASAARAVKTMDLFGTDIRRPALLDTATGLFDRPKHSKAYYRSRDGQVTKTAIPVLGRSPLNERRMLESFIESARYERAKRTQPVRDRLNRVIFPRICKEGFLIEELPNDDGTTCLIIATGLGASLSASEWQQAYGADIGCYRSAWNEKPYAILEEIYHAWNDREKVANPKSGVMPLFEVVLDEIVVRADNVEERRGEQVTLDMPDEWQ